MNRVELCAKVLVAWNLGLSSRESMYDDGYYQTSFIAKVLRKKLKVFGIKVSLPDPLIMLIEICTQNNPGISQLMLKEILMKVEGHLSQDKEYEVNPFDFSRAYPDRFPIVSEFQDVEEKFHSMWDGQKNPDGSNKCDTPEWWAEIYSQSK